MLQQRNKINLSRPFLVAFHELRKILFLVFGSDDERWVVAESFSVLLLVRNWFHFHLRSRDSLWNKILLIRPSIAFRKSKQRAVTWGILLRHWFLKDLNLTSESLAGGLSFRFYISTENSRRNFPSITFIEIYFTELLWQKTFKLDNNTREGN